MVFIEIEDAEEVFRQGLLEVEQGRRQEVHGRAQPVQLRRLDQVCDADVHKEILPGRQGVRLGFQEIPRHRGLDKVQLEENQEALHNNHGAGNQVNGPGR